MLVRHVGLVSVLYLQHGIFFLARQLNQRSSLSSLADEKKEKNKLRKFAGSCGSPCLCTRQVLWDYNCYFFWGGEERLFAGKKGRAYQSHHNWAVEYGSNVRDSSSSSSDQSLPPPVCVCVGDLCPWFWSGSFHTGGGDKDITASQIRLEMACWISRCLSHVSVET